MGPREIERLVDDKIAAAIDDVRKEAARQTGAMLRAIGLDVSDDPYNVGPNGERIRNAVTHLYELHDAAKDRRKKPRQALALWAAILGGLGGFLAMLATVVSLLVGHVRLQ